MSRAKYCVWEHLISSKFVFLAGSLLDHVVAILTITGFGLGQVFSEEVGTKLMIDSSPISRKVLHTYLEASNLFSFSQCENEALSPSEPGLPSNQLPLPSPEKFVKDLLPANMSLKDISISLAFADPDIERYNSCQYLTKLRNMWYIEPCIQG